MDAWPNAACPPFVASLTQHAPISTLADINFDCVSPVDVLQKCVTPFISYLTPARSNFNCSNLLDEPFLAYLTQPAPISTLTAVVKRRQMHLHRKK